MNIKKVLYIVTLATLMFSCAKEDSDAPEALWYLGKGDQSTDETQAKPKVFAFRNNSLFVNGECLYEFIEVQGGTFTMGADTNIYHDYNADELPQHQVTLSTYYIGTTEVPQRLWTAIMDLWF